MEHRLCVTDEIYAATVVAYPDIPKGILQQIADISGRNPIPIVACRYVVKLYTLRILESDAVQVQYADAANVTGYP